MLVQTYIRPEWRTAKIFRENEYNDMLSFLELQKQKGTLISVRRAECNGSERVIVHYSDGRRTLHGEKSSR